MKTSCQTNDSNLRYRTIRKVTILSAIANTMLAFFKLIIGSIGNSTALVADGVHSLSDLITDLLVILAAKTGSKKPDADHPYGHQRIETIATTLMAALLIAVGLSLAYHSIQKLLTPQPQIKISWAVWVTAAAAIFINEWFYRYTMHYSKKINSSLLKSNAWHHRSDALVSIIVLLSIVCQAIGISWGDTIGAIIIALLIVKIGGKMVWDSVRELVDTAIDPKTIAQIKQRALTIPGVISIHQVRSRTLAGQIYLDLHLMVSPVISVSEGHHIGEQVTALLKQENPQLVDITVHIDPEDDEINSPSLPLPNRNQVETTLRSSWENLALQDSIKMLQLHYLDGKLSIDVIFNSQDITTIQEVIPLYTDAAFTALPNLEKICYNTHIKAHNKQK